MEVDQNREDSSETPNSNRLGCVRLMGQKKKSALMYVAEISEFIC